LVGRVGKRARKVKIHHILKDKVVRLSFGVSQCFSGFPVKMDNLYQFVLSFVFGVSPTFEVHTHPEMAVEVA